MKRPLWWIGCLFAVTLLLLSCFSTLVAVYLGILCIFLCVPILFFASLRRKVAVWSVLLAVMAGCICSTFHRYVTVKPLTFPTEKSVSLTVRAEEITEQQSGRFYRFVVTEGDLPQGTVLSSYISHNQTFVCDLWQTVSGKFTVISTDSSYDRSRNILLRATPDNVAVSDTLSRPWYAFFSDIRTYACNVLHRYLSEDLAGLTQAICFGQQDLLPQDTESAFSETGLSHLLVASGMHVAILSQAVLLLLKKVGLSRRKAATIACAAVILVMGLCGFGYSVLRAGIMQLIVLSAYLFRREADGLNSLGGAMLLILFFQPYAITDIGLWLSFGATAGLLFFYPLLLSYLHRVRFAPLRYLLDALAVSVCATLPLLPLFSICFGEISLISPLANMAVCFVSSPLLSCTYLAVGFSVVPFLEFLTEGLLFIAGLLVSYLSQITELMAQIPAISTPVTHPFVSVLLIGALLSLWMFAFFGKKKKILLGFTCSAILFIGSFAVCANIVQTTSLTAFDIGDTTTLFLQKGEQTALILSADSEDGLADTASRLQENGTDRLDVLVLANDVSTISSDSVSNFVTAVPADRVIDTSAKQAISEPLWDGLSLVTYEGGWLRLYGDFSLLVTPPPNIFSDAGSLPTEWHTNTVVVFNRSVPYSSEKLTAEQGILCCDNGDVPFFSTAFAEFSYMVDINNQNTAITLYDNRIFS